MRALFYANLELFQSQLEWFTSQHRVVDSCQRFLKFVDGNSESVKEYDPFRDSPAMFKDLANTPQTESGILEFVHRHGLGDQEVRKWSLETWRRHITFLVNAEQLRLAILRQDHAALSKYVSRRGNRELEIKLPFVHRRRFKGSYFWDIVGIDGGSVIDSIDPLQFPSSSNRAPAIAILDILVRRMCCWGSSIELFTTADERVTIKIQVLGIQSILWTQFALAMSESALFNQCQLCGKAIDLRVTRSDAKFCSTNCRVQHSQRLIRAKRPRQ